MHVVVALAGIHALPPVRIRTLLIEQIDSPGRRLDPQGLDRPLAPFTADAVGTYLARTAKDQGFYQERETSSAKNAPAGASA